MAGLPEISDAEWTVMQVLWDRSPLTAAEVVDALAGRAAWAPATIKTLLGRLIRKGALSYTEDGNRYCYRPAVDRAACVRRAGRSFLDRVFAGDPMPALEHFVRSEPLSDDQIEALRRLLDECREGGTP
jgi:BlaI family penicillinase repressor